MKDKSRYSSKYKLKILKKYKKKKIIRKRKRCRVNRRYEKQRLGKKGAMQSSQLSFEVPAVI